MNRHTRYNGNWGCFISRGRIKRFYYSYSDVVVYPSKNDEDGWNEKKLILKCKIKGNKDVKSVTGNTD